MITLARAPRMHWTTRTAWNTATSRWTSSVTSLELSPRVDLRGNPGPGGVAAGIGVRVSLGVGGRGPWWKRAYQPFSYAHRCWLGLPVDSVPLSCIPDTRLEHPTNPWTLHCLSTSVPPCSLRVRLSRSCVLSDPVSDLVSPISLRISVIIHSLGNPATGTGLSLLRPDSTNSRIVERSIRHPRLLVSYTLLLLSMRWCNLWMIYLSSFALLFYKSFMKESRTS